MDNRNLTTYITKILYLPLIGEIHFDKDLITGEKTVSWIKYRLDN